MLSLISAPPAIQAISQAGTIIMRVQCTIAHAIRILSCNAPFSNLSSYPPLCAFPVLSIDIFVVTGTHRSKCILENEIISPAINLAMRVLYQVFRCIELLRARLCVCWYFVCMRTYASFCMCVSVSFSLSCTWVPSMSSISSRSLSITAQTLKSGKHWRILAGNGEEEQGLRSYVGDGGTGIRSGLK